MFCNVHRTRDCRHQACLAWYNDQGYNYAGMPDIGVDLATGDPVYNMGNGIGIDTVTGSVEIEIAPGVDI